MDSKQEHLTEHGDSYCGIWCGACSVLVHGESGQADGFIACCSAVPHAELVCGGCKTNVLYAGCRACGLRNCARKKGLAHCVDCADYPCKTYERWQLASRLLPHVGEARVSLEEVRRKGVAAWLAAQKRRWSCPACGTRFSWYATSCAECGRNLNDRAYTINGLRAVVCRFLFPRLYRRGKAKPG